MKSERGQIGLLFGIVIAIVMIGILAGIVGYLQDENKNDRPAYSEYVPDNRGDCFVPPQGDPLADEHWADINKKNCSALVNQSEAHNIDAQTRAINAGTTRENTGFFASMGSLGLVAFGLVLLGIVMLLRK